MEGVRKKYRINDWPFIFGYVYLPPKLNQDGRTKYINTCFRKQKISILLRDGGIAHNCPISKSKLREIDFPQEFGEVGSAVLCYVEPLKNIPFIFEVYGKDNDVDLSEEFEKRFKTINGDNLAELSLRGSNGEIDLNVDSNNENGGKIVINIKNSNRSGKLKINVLGESDIYTSSKLSVYSNSEVDLRVENLETEEVSSINIKGSEIVLNDNRLNSFIADINNLVERYNLTEDKVNEMIGIIRDTWVPVTMDGGAALKALFTSVIDMVNTEVEDIRDEKIKN